jgi:glucokinase
MLPNEKHAIGIDLGGTNVKIGIVSPSGRIIKKISIETMAEGGPSKVISQIKKGVDEVLSGSKVKITGIGIGSPGIVSPEKGTVTDPPNLPGWGVFNIVSKIGKEFKLKTKVENDANAAAIGEMIFGAGKKMESFILITLGTGVGGGIIFNRKIFRGMTGAAGELGHISINFNGPKCNCGSTGCVETYAGNSYLVKRVREELQEHKDSLLWRLINNDLNSLTPLVIDQALKQNDGFAVKVVNDLGVYVGYGLASIANAFDISTFIIGGGVAGFGEPLFKSIKETTVQRVMKPLRKRIKVLPAKLKNDAGIKGASSLIFYKS